MSRAPANGRARSDRALADEDPAPGSSSPAPASPRISPALRVWCLTFVVAATAGTLYATTVAAWPSLAGPLHVQWWMLALLFLLAEVFVVHLQFRGEVYT